MQNKIERSANLGAMEFGNDESIETAAQTGKKPSLFANQGFKNLWLGQMISQFGDVLHALVFLWMVLEVTGDPNKMGIVGAFEALPPIIFAVHAGVWADRHDRRKILLWVDWLCMGLVVGFAFLVYWVKTPSLPVVCAFAFALKSMTAFASPARSAALPRLVPSDQLIQATALNSTLQSIMPLIGNALSAMVLQVIFTLSKTMTYVATFLFNGATFLISALFMLRLPSLVPERVDDRKSTWNEMKEGVRFIREMPFLRVAILLSVTLNFFLAPFMPAYVVVAKQRFHSDPSLLAFLEVGFFLGMGAGSVIVMKAKIKRVGVAFSCFLSLAGLMMIPMGYTDSKVIFWIMNFLCGLCIPPAAIPIGTLTQLKTPDALRGRVNAALGMASMAVTPIGMALSGVLLKRVGVAGTFWYMIAGLTIPSMLGLLNRDFRLATMEGELASATE